jgi:dolichol-phosphate mannosyltransferase
MSFYSLVVPIYNDGDLVEDFCTEFRRVFTIFLSKENIEENVELIFVNDGSTNDSIHSLVASSKNYAFVKVIDLSRNFGQHIALSCGYKNAKGDFVGMLNVDQQDPISELPKFFECIEKNPFDIVYGLRDKRKSSFSDEFTSKVFHIVLNKLTDSQAPLNLSTMRVMSRRFIDAYNELKESERYLPGLENWLGFNVGYVSTFHVKRKKGESSYTFKKRLKLAINSILSFSDYPLRLMASLGFILAILGVIGVVIIIFLKLFFIDFQAGYSSLISVIILSSGMIIFSVGLSSLYIGKILKEVQQRPTYVIKDKYNLQ